MEIHSLRFFCHFLRPHYVEWQVSKKMAWCIFLRCFPLFETAETRELVLPHGSADLYPVDSSDGHNPFWAVCPLPQKKIFSGKTGEKYHRHLYPASIFQGLSDLQWLLQHSEPKRMDRCDRSIAYIFIIGSGFRHGFLCKNHYKTKCYPRKMIPIKGLFLFDWVVLQM